MQQPEYVTAKNPAPLTAVKCCWIGNGRYGNPLDSTSAKKWQALTALNIDLYVLAFANGLRPRCFYEHARFYLLPQPPLALLRYLVMFGFAPFVALWLIFRHGVNVFVAQSPYEGAIAAFAKNSARLFGRRVALAIENHGDFEVSLFMQRAVKAAGLYKRLMRTLARYAFRHADALRAVSDSTREQLETWLPGVPVQQFMAWTDADAFDAAYHAREKKPSQTQNILFVGALIPRKGVHILMEAFARIAQDFPAAHLYLVGKPENPQYTEELHTRSARLNLESRVTFVGALAQTELARYMANSRVLLLPSISEGLGRVIVEAMLCGTPVIGSHVGGIPDMIHDGENGYLIPADDVETLSTVLQTTLQNEAIDTMGENARTFAQGFFSKEAFVEGYRQLIAASCQVKVPSSKF